MSRLEVWNVQPEKWHDANMLAYLLFYQIGPGLRATVIPVIQYLWTSYAIAHDDCPANVLAKYRMRVPRTGFAFLTATVVLQSGPERLV